MATYKVPQDVEADDKLLGPFSFRQFAYLMLVGGLVVTAVGLFQIFPLLAVIPIPVAIFFLILALPLKKDQPMETYIAALISFYTRPHKRFWLPGQSESIIQIIAPKQIEESRVRNITEEEAGHRLSFLAAIVDSEGYAIKSSNSPMRDEFYAEANNAIDMFDINGTHRLNHLITKEQQERHNEVVNQMRAAIEQSASDRGNSINSATITNQRVIRPTNPVANSQSSSIIQPNLTPAQTAQMNNLAHNQDYSVETIQQQADRIRRENETEVYVALHNERNN